jgi:nucleoside-diphosphate-sugar epimerase
MTRWIRERLGTCAYDDVRQEGLTVLDVRHLVDKSGNPPGPISEIIRNGVEALRRGETVIIACDFGISRSNAIAAGILSLYESVPYDAAVRDVIRSTGEHEVKYDLVEAVRTALGVAQPRAPSQTVLVTGATGFIGRWLVRRLRETKKVVAPPRAVLDLEKGAVLLADYCNQETVGQIIHLAYPRAYTNAAAAASSLVMLRAVLDVCRLNKIRLVFVSGWVVFSGYSTSALFADEAMPMRPKGIYAESKYLEEILVDLHFRRHEIERCVCRLAPVYGPGSNRPRLIRTFHEAILQGKTIMTHRFRNGRPAMDLLHVNDAVEALVRVAQTDQSEIYHFGTGRLHSTAAIASVIGRLANRRVLHGEIEIADDTGNIAFRSEKATRALGWQSKVGIEAGLASMISDEGLLPSREFGAYDGS